MRIGSRCLSVILVLWSLAGAFVRAQGDASGTGSITGRITISGKPAAGVTVLLEREQRSGADNFYARLYQRSTVKSTTDADGVYHFDHLAAGNYALLASSLAYVVAKAWRNDWLPGKQIKLADGETLDNQDFTLARGGVISGRVTDEKGRPVVEQYVQLTSISEDVEHRVNLDAIYLFMAYQGLYRTDDRGVYRIYGLPSGRYVVSAGGSRMSMRRFDVKTKEYELTFYPGVRDQEKATVVEVKEGDELTGIDIRFGQPLPTYKVSGRVVDAVTGKPLVDVTVNHGERIGHDGPVNYSQQTMTALTNEKGEFQIKSLQPGKYAAYADFGDDSPYYSEYADFEIATADATGVTVKAHRGQIVSGTAVIEGGSEAEVASLAGLTLQAGSEGTPGLTAQRSYTAQLGPDASFRLSGVQPGKLIFYTPDESGPTRFTLLRVERGGAPQKEGLAINAGENINDVRIVLGVNAGVIRGEVKNAGDLPLKDAQLTALVRPLDNNISLKVSQVSADGQFTVEGLLPGEYEITIHVTNGNRQPLVSERVQVTKEKATTVSLTITLNKEK
ncbi:MAG TPA: carboxypeptidase regulatory-like domain-containing protein [Blastocatellia bacterium]|nr:carboxypeptidase regulatory-like domain-containing protein [Blastocatellia bacterium]